MRCTRLLRLVASGLTVLGLMTGTLVLAAASGDSSTAPRTFGRRPVNEAPVTGTAQPPSPARSFGSSNRTLANPHAVTVSRNVSVDRSPRAAGPAQVTPRPASIPNPRASGTATLAPAVPSSGVTRPVIYGGTATHAVPGASRAGDGVPGVISNRISNGPAPTSSVPVYRSSVPVNPTFGGNPRPVVRPNPPAGLPADPDPEWSRRYRERYDVYSRDHYHWGTHGPVFAEPYNPYYSGYGTGYYYATSPTIVNVIQPPPEAPVAVPDQPEEQAPAAERDFQEEGIPEDWGKDLHRPGRGSRISPEKLHELMIEGVKLFEARKYNEAASKFLRVTLADRTNVDATLAYAVARFATGDYQIAGLAIRRGVRRMPEVVSSQFDVRARYSDPKDFETHLARLERYLLDEPEAEDAWIVLGFVRHFGGQRELAVETFERLKRLPDADVAVADLFLEAAMAEPAPAQSQPAGEFIPMVPAGADRPLPDNLIASHSLITVDEE